MNASAPTLERFFDPRAVAVVGASPEKTKIRGLLFHLLRKNGYAGEIYPINPSYSEIDGVRCFPSVAAVGKPIDLALIAIPAEGVPAILEECASAKVRYAVIISSGFAEEGGAQLALQERIVEIARRTGMRISGPNGEGFHNEIGRVSATFSPAVDVMPGEEPAVASARRVGVVAQSGGIGFALYNRGKALGVGFSYVISTGNEADLTAADFFLHMVEDEATSAVLLFLESVRAPARFLAAARRAAELGKPVVAVKVGRSQAGQRATASHTASMAGWDAAYDAVFRKFGIIVASEPDEAVAIMAALVTAPTAKGNRAAVVTVSGGAGAWAADALAAAGLEVPELAAETQATIRGFIPSYGSARNPVDITAQAVHTGGLARSIELLIADPGIDLVVVVTSLASETRVPIDEALKHIIATAKKPLLFYTYTLPSVFGRKALAEHGAVIFAGLAELGAASRALVARGRQQRPSGAAAPSLPTALRTRLAALEGTLAEHEAKALLAAAGIATAPHRLVAKLGDLPAAAKAIGFPLAVKIQSRDLPHKTEADGVVLGVADETALRDAYEEVLASARRHAPQARIDGVLLERMAPKGFEMIVGVVRDPVFGPVMMVGAGGVATELFKDAVYRLAPVDAREAKEMVGELRSAALLRGFRGASPADVDALAALIAQLSHFAVAAADTVREVELNPVFVHAAGEGCTIADALLVAERR